MRSWIGQFLEMECPEKWELVGNALVNLKSRLLTQRVVVAMNLVRQEVHRLGVEKGIECLFGLERRERARTSLEANRLAKGEGVMELGEIHALWLVMRCECAADFLGQMFPPLSKNGPCQEIPAGWTEEDALAWVLTELWNRKSDSWLKLVALEWIGPFPFYGIEPAPDFV